MRPRLLLLLSAFCVAVAAPAQDAGPLEIRNMRSLSVPFLRLKPRGSVLAKGLSEWSIEFSASNDARFLQSAAGRTLEDYELEQLWVSYRKGIGSGYDLTLEAAWLARGGGFLDPFISFWHRAVLGTQPQIRENSPLGRCIVEVPGHGVYGGASGISDLAVSVAKQLDRRFAVAIAAKVPLASRGDLLGSGAPDLGASLYYSALFQPRLTLHAQLGGVIQGHSSEFREARALIWQASTSLVYRWNSRLHVIGQWQSEPSAMVTGVAPSDSVHSMVSLGLRHRFTDETWGELFMSEDGDWLHYSLPFFANIAPDVTLGMRYIRRF